MRTPKIFAILAFVLLMIGRSYSDSSAMFELKGKQKFVYRVKVSNNVYTETTEYDKATVNGKNCVMYISTGDFTATDKHDESGNHRWEVLADYSGIPVKIGLYSCKNSIIMKFDGKGNVDYAIDWKNTKRIGQKIFRSNVSFENALIVRTLDFNRKDRYIFDLIQARELPEIVSYEMYFQVLDNKRISVEAGVFNCRKILFSLTGFKGMFYKAYYYVSDDPNRYIVKIENVPMNGSSELVLIKTQ